MPKRSDGVGWNVTTEATKFALGVEMLMESAAKMSSQGEHEKARPFTMFVDFLTAQASQPPTWNLVQSFAARILRIREQLFEEMEDLLLGSISSDQRSKPAESESKLLLVDLVASRC